MNLLKDNIPKLVRKLALPAMVGTLFQTLYNIVDTFFAGKISPEALSALSKSFPIYFIIVATSIGVTVAGTSLIGNSIGEKDKDKTLNYFTHIIFYGILVSIIITYLGLSYAEKVFYLMGSTDEVISLGLEYTNVIYLGSVLFILVVALNSFLHAEGDTKTYRNVLVLSFFLNIILNPILIFGFLFIPAMGVKGIGIATIIAQSMSLIIILIKVLKNKNINLFINIASMQEMKTETVDDYFQVIKSNSAYFYCCNSEYKKLIGGEELIFDQYPWGDCKTIVSERCPWYKQFYSPKYPFIINKENIVKQALVKYS